MTLSEQLTAAYESLLNCWLEPRDTYDQEAGWVPLGGGMNTWSPPVGPTTPAELDLLRDECRALALTNEYAVNGHENRISYIIGPGHQYRVVLRRGETVDPRLITAAQCEIDAFLRENQWSLRQQEIVRRRDRDGEALLRFFVSPEGKLRVRFIDPALLRTPVEQSHHPEAGWGILTDPDDVETVRGYFVGDDFLPADQVQHRKAHVDADTKRGLPLYTPVRKNLRRAEKLLRNMTLVAEIQSAVALIRKHRVVRTAIDPLTPTEPEPTLTAPRAQSGRRIAPGSILDATGNIEYEFPAAGINAGSYVTVLQAELQAIASRLVMPEFMLSSDASNANYSSTLVAEGPAMRMFARLQGEQIAEDLVVMERVLDTARRAGRLPFDACHRLEVTALPPSLAMRKQLQEAKRFKLEAEAGILSPQTWCQRVGLDYDQERENLRRHRGDSA